MADVLLGRVGADVDVDLDVCAKTGETTDQRVTMRGTTTPGWVLVLLLFTVIGFLLAQVMTSRRYSVTLPFVHRVHDRWKRTWLLAWAVGVVGVGAVIAAATDSGGEAGLWGGVGIALIAAALVGGTINSSVNGLGVRATRSDDLVLTRAHPAFARAVAAASVESAQR